MHYAMPRTNHTVRLSDGALAQVRELMTKHKATKADVLRALLSVALQHPLDVDRRIKEIQDA